VLGIAWVVIHPVTAEGEEVGTAFTYQGRLLKDGEPVDDTADFRFGLWDQATGGNTIGPQVTVNNKNVADGLFTVMLDFTVEPYTKDNSEARWLETEVRSPAGGGGFTKLPRQKLTPTPFSLATRGINVDDLGKVGIGTTTPISMLELESTADVHGIRSTVPWIPVWAHRDSTTGTWPAIHGECDSEASNSSAVRGIMTSTSPGSSSAAVKGVNNGTSGAGIGVYGSQDGSGWGVYGFTPSGRGVYGESTSGDGVVGTTKGINMSGVYGECGLDADGYGVFGRNDRTFHQMYGFVGGPSHGAYGCSDDTLNQEWTVGYLGGTYSVYGSRWNGNAGTAGYFAGKVTVTGTLSKGGGSFKIDHPLDPENKYLYHSFVESPDMMNIYNGNETTDENGYAEVILPEWFDALNRDFRYQLTVIGQFAQAIVGEEIRDNRFVIRTDKPDVKVSWQVTGIRKDRFANKYRIPVEEDKPKNEQGKYLHPEAYGQPIELQIGRIEPLSASQTPSLSAEPVSANMED